MHTSPLRHNLGVSPPRTLYRVHDVDLAVHDRDPTSENPVLVCLHAIGHGGGDFARVEEAQSPRFRVISVDWPGQGYSGDDTIAASAIRYAELLEALLDRLGVRRAVLLGNSIGGAASVRYAAAHPDRVRALILANPGGFDPRASSFFGKLFIGNFVRRFKRGAARDASFAAWFARYYEGILKAPAAAARKAAIVAAGYESAPVLAQAWDSFRQEDANLAPLLARLTMPVLVTWAKQDAIITWSGSRKSIARLENAKVVFFDAGHSAFLEQPDAFNAELASFLSAID